MTSVAYVMPGIARRLRTLLDDAALLQDSYVALIAAPRITPGARAAAAASFTRWRRDADAIVALIGRRGIVAYRDRAIPLALVELELALLADDLEAMREV